MIQVCRDTSDAVPLYLPQRLYLKPFAKLNISVQLPGHKVHGKPISNWELMEKLRKMIHPDSFSVLKNTKYNPDVIRFDAELEQHGRLERVLARLDGRIIQLTEHPEPLKVKVCEAKLDFPSRHSWDSFFRDAPDMDEMKPGERPDTVHIRHLPIRWFVHDKDHDEDAPPSETIVKRCFEKYGNIRQIDVPTADPYRMQMKAHMRGISIPAQESALYFESYVQFSEYLGFVRCMDALRGKKLLRKREDMAEWVSISVDFDKTKHMTDASVKRRSIVRERLIERQRAKEEAERTEKEKQAKREAKERQKFEKVEREKLEKMREREEKRKKKQLAKLMEQDNMDLNTKVLEEQGRLMKAQKRLQAVRLMDELFKRIELRPELQHVGPRETRYYQAGERTARARIVDRYKRQAEDALETQRLNLKSAMEGRIVIRSALETKKPRGRESSASSLSTDGGRGSRDPRDLHDPRDPRDPRHYDRVKTEKLSTPERELEYSKATGMFPMPNPYGYGYPFGPVPPPHGFPFQQAPMYFPVRGQYFPPPPDAYARRPFRFRGRGRGRGGPRMPHFDGPDASQQYYKYFKRLTEQETRNEHDHRSRSRSRRRTASRSHSRSRRRSYSRSRSHSHSRRRSRSDRSRSHRSRRSRSHHSRSKSRSRQRSTTPRRSESPRRSMSPRRSKSPKSQTPPAPKSPNGRPATPSPRARSKSWSLPKDGDSRQWSKSPRHK